jgi:capsular exopolysaccharide synthesis family protein
MPTAGLVGEFSLEEREQRATGMLVEGLTVTLVRSTNLLEVRFVDGNPKLATAIANQYLASFMDQQVDRTIETSDLARQFLLEQIADIKRKLEAAETALVNYAKQEALTSAGADGSLITTKIAAINDALTKASQDRMEAERLVALIEEGKAADLPQLLESEAIQNTRQKLTELEADYAQKRQTFKPDFPEMKTLRSQINGFEAQLDKDIGVISESIRVTLNNKLQEERDLRATLFDLDRQQTAFRDKSIQYQILKRDVDSLNSQYKSLIDKQNELGVVSDLRSTNMDVVDYAVTPENPFEPSLLRNLALAGLMGLAGAALAIYVLELLNNKFDVPDQVESELRLPVLGVLPSVEAGGLDAALADPRSALSEAYRSLRTALQFATVDGEPRSILVTSSEPDEAKSTTAVKLAEEFAAIGVKVLVIDCDLRRPSLHRLVGIDNSIGLSNLLTKTIAPEDVHLMFNKSATSIDVTFMGSGPMVPNPADLLASRRMGEVMAACLKLFGMVILDGPPVLGLADTLILSRHAEATILLVAAHQTPRKAAAAALKRLRSTVGAKVVGGVLSKLDTKRIEYTYSYGYMHNQYYYGYGQDESRVRRLKGRDGEPEEA